MRRIGNIFVLILKDILVPTLDKRVVLDFFCYFDLCECSLLLSKSEAYTIRHTTNSPMHCLPDNNKKVYYCQMDGTTQYIE